MNQRVIDVRLEVRNDTDVLVFELDESQPDLYVVNLNSENNQNEIKKVFSKMLQLLISENIKLELRIGTGYSKGLYKDVCTEYIKDLNKEIEQVKELIQKEIT